MSLRENRPAPSTNLLPELGSRPDLRSSPTSQAGSQHFVAQSRLWGALHERLGRAGVASLLAEGPRDALELQILHVAGFVESTGIDASAYLPWSAPLSWQERTQPFYRALLSSIEERAAEPVSLAPLEAGAVDAGGLGAVSLDAGAVTLDTGLGSGDLGMSDTMGALDAFGGGWTGLSGELGGVGADAGLAGGEGAMLSRDALGAGPTPEEAFSSWFGTRLEAAGGGRALTAEEQDFLREVHGRSFDDVRVHEGPSARQASRAIAARAFTLGEHIFIGESGGPLDSAAGAELLAHEATHVAQADSGSLPAARGEGLSVSSPNQPHERAAEAIGRRARAVFETFQERSPVETAGDAAWELDPSWDGDPVGAAVAAHLRAVLPSPAAPEAELVEAELRQGLLGRARASLTGQHVLVDVAEALGEDAEIVGGLRGVLGGLEAGIGAAGLDDLAALSGAPAVDALAPSVATPGFEAAAADLMPAPSADLAPLGGDGLGGMLFGGGAVGAEAGGAEAGGGEAVARKAAGGAGEEGDATGLMDRAMKARGQGSPLPQDLRGRLEARLGLSLAGVRLHTDAKAAEAAEAVNATAFTVGQDIYFNAGAFNPSSPDGVELIAHEATHAAQHLEGREGQASASEGGVGVTKPGDAVEVEAEAVGAEIASGQDVASDAGASVEATSPSAGLEVGGGLESGAGASLGASVGAETSADASGDAGGDVVARSLLDSASSLLGGMGAPLSRVAAGGSNSPLGLLRSIGPKLAAGVPGLQQAMPIIDMVIDNKGIPGLDSLDDKAIEMLGSAVPGLEAAMPLIQSVVENKGLPSLKDLGGPLLTELGKVVPGVGAALPLVQGLLSGEGITAKNLTGAVMGALGTAIPGMGVALPLVESLLGNKTSGVGGLLSGASGLLGGASQLLTGAGGLLTGAGSLLGRASGLMSGAENLMGTLAGALPGGSLIAGLMQNKDVLGAVGGGFDALFGTIGAAVPGLGEMLGGGIGGLVGGAGSLLGGLFGGGQDGGSLGGMLGTGLGGLGGGVGSLLGGLLGDNKQGTLGGGLGMGSLLQGAGLGGLGQMLPLLQTGMGVGGDSRLGELGAPGQLAMQALQLPGISDLINVVETGLSNVAGEGKGLGRGSLAEGSDTVGWIMQAVPGLPQLVSVLRGGLADQMSNGTGSNGPVQSSGTAGEENVGSSDRILGLDLGAAVGAGLSQVGGPTAGAAAHAGASQGRGAIDTLDTAIPGLSEFIETARSLETTLGGPPGQHGGGSEASGVGLSGRNAIGGMGGLANKGAGALGGGARALGGRSNKAGGLLGGLF